MIITIKNVEKTISAGDIEFVDVSMFVLRTTEDYKTLHIFETDKITGKSYLVCHYDFIDLETKVFKSNKTLEFLERRLDIKLHHRHEYLKPENLKTRGCFVATEMFRYRIDISNKLRKHNPKVQKHIDELMCWGFAYALETAHNNQIPFVDFDFCNQVELNEILTPYMQDEFSLTRLLQIVDCEIKELDYTVKEA